MNNSENKYKYENVTNRTARYLKRTIKKNNQEILKDKKYIKLLKDSLKYMTDYAISSYDYNCYLTNFINSSAALNPSNNNSDTNDLCSNYICACI